jgi:hypothetical protein
MIYEVMFSDGLASCRIEGHREYYANTAIWKFTRGSDGRWKQLCDPYAIHPEWQDIGEQPTLIDILDRTEIAARNRLEGTISSTADREANYET